MKDKMVMQTWLLSENMNKYALKKRENDESPLLFDDEMTSFLALHWK